MTPVIESLLALEKELTEQVGNEAVEMEKARAAVLAAQEVFGAKADEHWRLTRVLKQVKAAVADAKGGKP